MYEAKIAQARSDLSHVTAVLRRFKVWGRGQHLARYMDSYRLFKRGEILATGLLGIKELALELKTKGMDLKDAVLARTIGAPAHSFAADARTAGPSEARGQAVWG
jgi:hypothetical protein